MSIPGYKSRAFSKEFIPVDVFQEISYSKIDNSTAAATLLDHMISKGKLIYFTDLMLPEYADSLKIKFPSTKLDWCNKNEKNIWAFIIENKLLYSTDPIVMRDLIDDAPFTKGFGEQSPGRIGVWLGWKIVSSYMNNHPDQHPSDLFSNQNSQEILKKSLYKPK
ncbi:MAG: hypothetical protein JEZ03_11035 [Bacteroidales bacterium]|nr:hypothetical protein [Bacteroidales bacterium]